MEISDYKKYLKERGMSEKLIEMPAVTNYILNEAINYNLPLDTFRMYVTVESPTVCKLLEKRVKLNEDGTADIEHYNHGRLMAKAKTDECGFEVEYEDVFAIKDKTKYKRNNGFIDMVSITSTLDGTKKRRSCFDVGNIQAWTKIFGPEDDFGRQIAFDEDAIWNEFENNERSVLKIYPHLKRCFDELRQKLKKRIEEEKTPERKRESEEKEEANLNDECRRLSKILGFETRFLEIQLDFIKRVKRHPIGRFIFEEQLKKYNERLETYNKNKESKQSDDESRGNKGSEDADKMDTEERLKRLRERRTRLIDSIKRTGEMKEIAHGCAKEITENTGKKLLSILPVYLKYAKECDKYYKDYLEHGKKEEKEEER